MLKIWNKSWELFEIRLLKAQPIQAKLGENGLDRLCYLAGNSQTAPMIFFIFSAHFLKIL